MQVNLLRIMWHLLLGLRPSVVCYEFLEERDRRFGCPGSSGVIEINLVQSERLAVTLTPLEVVHQGPGCVSDDIAAIQLDSYNHSIDN